MDVYCGHCAEPWDTDEVQFEWISADRGAFLAGRGCPCCNWGKAQVLDPEQQERADMATAALLVCGDDLDGAASLMDDFSC